ncbi:MAG: serine hydrolase [Acidobacteria bacterium]|nr:serine hydrolase [Acidobacteriota bacterium]
MSVAVIAGMLLGGTSFAQQARTPRAKPQPSQTSPARKDARGGKTAEPARKAPEEFTIGQRIDSLLTEYASEGVFNGTVLVADRGQIVFSRGYGYANIEWQVPNAPDTKFRIASLTKQFTAMLALQLVAEGRLRLDATISDYLPEYPVEQGRKITIHHLLTHTSGIPEYTWTADLIGAQVPNRPDDFIKRFSTLPLEFEPGSSYSYSNSGYYVLGVILERVSGRRFEQLLHEQILDPLGMRDTGYDHVQELVPRRATGYLRVLAGRENSRYRYVDPEDVQAYAAGERFEHPIYRDMITMYAAGAMYSTAEDLYRWDRALASGTLLPPALMESYFRPGLSNYAYGWFVAKVPVQDVLGYLEDFEDWKPDPNYKGESITLEWHGGSVNGFMSSIVRVPELGQLIIVLNNTGMTRLAEINAGIMALLNNTRVPPVRRSVAERVARTLLEGGQDAGTREFRDLAKRTSEGYFVSLAEISTLSRRLREMSRTREAITLLELGAEVYPDSARFLDQLAQAYQANGEVRAARERTQAMLEIVGQDPRIGSQERDSLRRRAEERLRELGGELQEAARREPQAVGSAPSH